MTPTIPGGAGHYLTILCSFLVTITTALSHSDAPERRHDHGALDGVMADDAAVRNTTDYPNTYFAHTESVVTVYAHIAFMVIGWIFVLPIVSNQAIQAVMLSIAKSRYTLAIQFIFMILNAIGVILGMIYNNNTPDLYPHNSHHKIGWIITWVISAHVLMNTVSRITNSWSSSKSNIDYKVLHPFLPISEQNAVPHARDGYHGQEYRTSDDSGHGTASTSSSIRNVSFSAIYTEEIGLRDDDGKEYEHVGDTGDDFENLPLLSGKSLRTIMIAKAAQTLACGVWRYFELGYKVVDRVILPFGFIALATGVVTFARFFEGHAIFGGLAHWIKGGVFFWLGLFNLGRWSGSFSELGWAWNIRPRTDTQDKQKFHPSAEFVESCLILFYGSTNIFLEHLGGWGGEWSAQDLEHMAITVLFIGGGLCGILIESTRVRDLLNAATTAMPTHSYSDDEQQQVDPPETYKFSLNPIPALVILLLGIMMSSHHQTTKTASMVHKQWGTLLLWASVARGLTYVVLYVRPPRSIFPSRPPTELLTSFGLIAGGITFMASSSDTVSGMIHYDLDAMFLYTVTMGLVGMLMAWELIVLAIKGWAVRKELARSA
ncbi:hypothetical protein NLG97_g78 [Lecanicillium saksenae]|uniref:Uncharacterized protein n=1 Tax=Lecanicillium saksenae TaxID=468837 RepID=A0ACC1R7P8_9HYPO|nr:hypothetical protein NLG97_g78 [Lecanicillium saksenae]